MDISETIHPEASTSSHSASTQLPSSSTSESRPLRSSARVKAAKQNKDKATELDLTPHEASTSSAAEANDTRTLRSNASRSKRTRDAKGKGKETSPDSLNRSSNKRYVTKLQADSSASDSSPLGPAAAQPQQRLPSTSTSQTRKARSVLL